MSNHLTKLFPDTAYVESKREVCIITSSCMGDKLFTPWILKN